MSNETRFRVNGEVYKQNGRYWVASNPRQINLKAPRFLYMGQAFRYSPENALYIFNQQIQGVTGGTDQTSGECSLGQTIPI